MIAYNYIFGYIVTVYIYVIYFTWVGLGYESCSSPLSGACRTENHELMVLRECLLVVLCLCCVPDWNSGRFCCVLQRFRYFGATRFIPYVRLTFINIYSTFPICVDSVCLLGRGVGWCLALSNFLCLLRAIFSPLIQGNLSVCRCMAIFFIMFCGMFNTAFYSISFKVYSHTLGLYFFPLYGNSSCGSLGSGSDGVSIDLQFYTLLSALPFLCFG